MFGWIAVGLFLLGALLIFGKLSGVNAEGVIALGLASLAVHESTSYYPWRRGPRV